MACAIIGPAWHFLDPFSTLHDLGAAVVRRLGIAAWEPADYPERLGRWPGVIGFAAFVWLELAMGGGGPSVLFIVLHRLHGLHPRDDGPVRSRRMAVARRGLHGLVPPARPVGRLRAGRRGRAGSGAVRSRAACSSRAGPVPDVALVGLGIGSILFDGLYQTQAFFDGFGTPDVAGTTVLLAVWLGAIVLAALGGDPCRRRAGDRRRPATDRGRLPHRPLPDVPLIDGPEHPHRDLRTRSSAAGTCSGPRSTRRTATGCHPASSGRSSWRPSSAATCWAPGPGT